MKFFSARGMAWCLLAAAAFLAWRGERSPAVEPPRRGNYLVLEADFHVHGILGDGALAPWDLVREARRRGLHAIAITNHNGILAARIGRFVSRLGTGPIVLVGQEVTAPAYHMTAVGIGTVVDASGAASAAIAAIHAQGGVAIAAHPVRKFWPAFDEAALSSLDGAELSHPTLFERPRDAADLPEFFQRARAVNPSLAAIGSSDFHTMSALGLCRTYVFVTEIGERGVLEAIRAGRTVVFDKNGIARGDPALLPLMAGFVPVSTEPAHDLRVSGVLALLGWAGLLVVGKGETQPSLASS
ncbi:MAG: CehA/McbA family metallohydrolase [Thermoanaerobaculia bacterium]